LTAVGRTADLARALHEIEAGAEARDREPAFPREALRALGAVGVLSVPVPNQNGVRRGSFSEEWRVLRSVARADSSVARIVDGHLHAVERVAALAPATLRARELSRVMAGELLLGVWGADPIPGEGEPARLDPDGRSISGVKIFCSGATGLDRALVAVVAEPGEPGPPLVAYVDLSGGVEVDEGWFRGSGMRASESHRVIFDRAPVLAVLGQPGELVREPYFSRDAIRTASAWAGIADRAVDAALRELEAKSAGREPDDIVSLAAGRMLVARQTIDLWLEHAGREADRDPQAVLKTLSVGVRAAVAGACREILTEAAAAVGSRPFAVGGPLDRARRDLELFLLQHRLEPALARHGRASIVAARDEA
jgi:alkylation response protein AidB-like acyl-CoA dehydrogenase